TLFHSKQRRTTTSPGAGCIPHDRPRVELLVCGSLLNIIWLVSSVCLGTALFGLLAETERPGRFPTMSSGFFARQSNFFGSSIGILSISASLLCATCSLPAAEPKPSAKSLPPPAARAVDFAKDIQPIFAGHCYGCH